MSEQKVDDKAEELLDEAALNEEASRELEALVAAEATGAEDQDSEDGGTYAVQNAAERKGIIEALIFVSEEPLTAKSIVGVLREERELVEAALRSLTKGILVAGKAEVVVSVDPKGAITGTAGISENPKGSGLGELLNSAVRKAQFTPAYENGKPAVGGVNVVASFGRF